MFPFNTALRVAVGTLERSEFARLAKNVVTSRRRSWRIAAACPCSQRLWSPGRNLGIKIRSTSA